jgi:hypothetical protein
MELTIQDSDLGSGGKFSPLQNVPPKRLNKHCAPRDVNKGHYNLNDAEILTYRFINIQDSVKPQPGRQKKVWQNTGRSERK